MRSIALLTLLISLTSWRASAQAESELVTGFHGYPWGTRIENILEIAGTQQVGQREGLPIYSTQVNVMGRQGLAGFYFHPETRELMEGAYVFALTLGECERAWSAVTRSIGDEYPGLQRAERVPTRVGEDLEVYDSDCEYFLFNDHLETWTADFTHAGPPGDRVAMWMRSISRIPRLTVVYRGSAAQAWIERRAGG